MSAAATTSQPPTNTNTPPPIDTEILHERLITREGGGGAQRGTFSKCLIRFRDVCQYYEQQQQQQNDDDDIISSFKRELSLHDLEMRKMLLVSNMSERELREYEATQVEVEKEIQKAKEEVEKLKKDLEFEKLVRRNRDEYESLAKVANTNQARRDTKKKLEEVNKQMEKVREEQVRVTKMLEVREKQFQLLLQSIFDLKASLTEGDDENHDGKGEEGMDVDKESGDLEGTATMDTSL